MKGGGVKGEPEARGWWSRGRGSITDSGFRTNPLHVA